MMVACFRTSIGAFTLGNQILDGHSSHDWQILPPCGVEGKQAAVTLRPYVDKNEGKGREGMNTNN